MAQSPTASGLALAAFLCERSVKARQLFGQFLDDYGVVGGVKIDGAEASGSVAVSSGFADQPTERFLACLAAMITADQYADSL